MQGHAPAAVPALVSVPSLVRQAAPVTSPPLPLQAEAQQTAPSMAAAGGQAGSRGRSRLQEGLPAAQAHSLLQLVLKRRAVDTSKVKLTEEEEAFMVGGVRMARGGAVRVRLPYARAAPL